VTKDELLHAAWADTAVNENSLTQSIRQPYEGAGRIVVDQHAAAR
jgi:hypothetical protein